MPAESIELPQGTLDLLILRTWHWSHCTAGPFRNVFSRFQATCCGCSRVHSIPLFIASSAEGWIRARWGTSDNNRRAKFYELTKTARRRLEIEWDAWEKLTAVVSQILGTA
jgi:hypothetical protein